MLAALSRCAALHAVLLTTHAMDEAEALCHEVGIMVDGRLRCLGPVAALRQQRGGGGHALLLHAPAGACARVAELMAVVAPGAVLSERHATRLSYEIRFGADDDSAAAGASSVSLPDLVEALERARASMGVWGYSLRAAPLEQVFLAVASAAAAAEQAAVDVS
jgi:ABC-type multidrug transport system ATPase subunit